MLALDNTENKLVQLKPLTQLRQRNADVNGASLEGSDNRLY